jgi:serine/threonine protein kinase
MVLPMKYKKAEILRRYPLGMLMRFTDSNSGESNFAKIFSPPVTLPEDLIESMLEILEVETQFLDKSKDKWILPSIRRAKYKNSVIIDYQDPGYPSLEKYVYENRPLSVEIVMGLLDQAGLIFSRLSEFGIFRFQFEPSILPVNPGNHVISYLDTGFVNFAKTPELIMLGYLDGLPQFLPPELLKGNDLVTASEVYFFGVLAHYLLNGQLSFSGHSLVSTAGHCLSEHISQVEHFSGLQGKKINDLLSRATEKDPSKRISSLNPFLEELRQVLFSD